MRNVSTRAAANHQQQPTMSEEVEEIDPNATFDVRELHAFIRGIRKGWDEAIEFLNNSRMITPENKKAAVDQKEYRVWSTLMNAAWGSKLSFIKQLYNIGGKDLIMAIDTNESTILHYCCCPDEPSLDRVMFLVEKGGKELMLIQEKKGATALHNACDIDNPNLELVQFLIEKGGRQLLMMQNNAGKTALDNVQTNKEGGVYKYLIEARDYPFHAHCSTALVTVSTIQEHIDKDGPDCLFQTNKTNMIPLHKLSSNQSAPRDSINLVIVIMLQERGIQE
jgi:hypothetical protein